MTIYPETRPNWHDQDEPDAVHLGQGVYALPGLKAKFSTDLGNVTLELSMEAGRYVVRSLTLGQHRESPPITSELLRRARVQEWVNAHVPRGVRVYDPEQTARVQRVSCQTSGTGWFQAVRRTICSSGLPGCTSWASCSAELRRSSSETSWKSPHRRRAAGYDERRIEVSLMARPNPPHWTACIPSPKETP